MDVYVKHNTQRLGDQVKRRPFQAHVNRTDQACNIKAHAYRKSFLKRAITCLCSSTATAAPEGHSHGLEGKVTRQPRGLLLHPLNWCIVLGDAHCCGFVASKCAKAGRRCAESEVETKHK